MLSRNPLAAVLMLSCLAACAERPQRPAADRSGELENCETSVPNATVTSCYEHAAATVRSKVDETFDRVLIGAGKADADFRQFGRSKRAAGRTRPDLVGFLKSSQAAWIEYSNG